MRLSPILCLQQKMYGQVKGRGGVGRPRSNALLSDTQSTRPHRDAENKSAGKASQAPSLCWNAFVLLWQNMCMFVGASPRISQVCMVSAVCKV